MGRNNRVHRFSGSRFTLLLSPVVKSEERRVKGEKNVHRFSGSRFTLLLSPVVKSEEGRVKGEKNVHRFPGSRFVLLFSPMVPFVLVVTVGVFFLVFLMIVVSMATSWFASSMSSATR